METRLYVGNLTEDVSVDSLRKLFAEHGVVVDVQIATDRASGRMRGYAFVTMASQPEAKAAIEKLDGAMFDERPLRVNEAGAEREGARTKARDAARAARITLQFRERLNMTYEIDCAGTALVLKIFPPPKEGPQDGWRIEASTKGAADVADTVVAASGTTRALALEEVGRSWAERSASGVPALATLDWVAITNAMAAVRAI